MKEWTIRMGCVLLGAVLTFGTIKVTDIVKNIGRDNKAQEAVDESTSLNIGVISEEDKEPVQNYELEAEIKYQQLADNKEKQDEDSENENTQEETETVTPEQKNLKWIQDYPKVSSDSLLEDKEAQRSSYDETMAVNAFDKLVIANSTVDFSDVKITVMGDSITEGNTLPEDEKAEYNWPAQLQKILGCKEVVNLGKGGSTVSCCVDNYPMCKRWVDIPGDSDIIIVMGGSNDMLFESKWDYGTTELGSRTNPATFCGDLEDMCSRMNWVYALNNEETVSKLLFINPPSSSLNYALYANDPDNIMPQKAFAEAINEIAPAYGFEVIDMYNNNILNSIDPDINHQFVPDGIHCNKEGYTILAEHVASQIIQRIEQ